MSMFINRGESMYLEYLEESIINVYSERMLWLINEADNNIIRLYSKYYNLLIGDLSCEINDYDTNSIETMNELQVLQIKKLHLSCAILSLNLLRDIPHIPDKYITGAYTKALDMAKGTIIKQLRELKEDM